MNSCEMIDVKITAHGQYTTTRFRGVNLFYESRTLSADQRTDDEEHKHIAFGFDEKI